MPLFVPEVTIQRKRNNSSEHVGIVEIACVQKKNVKKDVHRRNAHTWCILAHLIWPSNGTNMVTISHFLLTRTEDTIMGVPGIAAVKHGYTVLINEL